jgi:predicted O-methyltransferase YrrM
MTHGGSSTPEVQRLLIVLATGKKVAEAGTAVGEGAAAMARTADSVVTVELDPERAAIASRRLEPFSNVELLVGDWRELLPPRAPFDLVFVDAGAFDENGDVALSLLETGGLLVKDDLTPGRPGPDPVREWALENPQVAAVEILTTPTTSALLVTRLG